jgi:hypothetical protein
MPRSPSRRLLASVLAVALLLVPALALGPPPLCDPPGDGITRALTAAYTHGVSATVSATGIGALAGSPTPTRPVRFTLAKAAAVSAAGTITVPSQSGVYRAVGFTADTLTGVTFESGTDQDFAVGDWIGFAGSARYIVDVNARLRVLARSYVSVLDAGTVVGDGVTDDGPAIQAILDANPSRKVYFPRTATTAGGVSYYSSVPLVVTSDGQGIVGDGSGYSDGTILKFAAGVPGIDIRHTATRAEVRNFILMGQEPWEQTYFTQGVLPAGFTGSALADAVAPSSDGVRVGANLCRITDVLVQRFGRHGFNYSNADVDGGLGVSDNCTATNAYARNCRGYGHYVQGGDSNASLFVHAEAQVCALGGIFDNSFLGNTWISPKTDENHVDNATLGGGSPPVLPTTQPLASLARASGVVTLTFASAYTGGDAAGTGFKVGHGITVGGMTDASYNGTFVVHFVSGAVVKYAMAGADASPSVAGAVAGMARMQDAWTAAGIPPTGGAYRTSLSTAHRSAWINPYSEGGQSPDGTGPSALFGSGATILNSIGLSVDFSAGGRPGVFALLSGIGQQGFDGGFPSVLAPFDTNAISQEWVGRTSDQDSIRYRKRFDGSAYLWTHTEGPNNIRLYKSDPASDGSAVLVQDIDRASGNVTFGRAVATWSGPTGSRPTATAVGSMIYDTTLGLPLWWSGGNWRDAAGNVR